MNRSVNTQAHDYHDDYDHDVDDDCDELSQVAGFA